MIKRMSVATFLLFAVLLLMLPRTDDTSKKKMASAAMLMCSNAFREEIAKQLTGGDEINVTVNITCPDLLAAMRVDDDGVVNLLGARHGINMVLTPRMEQGKVRWGCRGTPPEAITKLCRP